MRCCGSKLTLATFAHISLIRISHLGTPLSRGQKGVTMSATKHPHSQAHTPKVTPYLQ